MYWYESLYVSDSMRGMESKIIEKINKPSLFVKGYFVCLATNKDNLFDIISAREISQAAYPKDKLHIIGICGTKDEAIELVAGLAQKYYLDSPNINLKEQFTGNWRDSIDFS